MLGPLGAKPSVPAECLFVDPVADLAVLGSVDGQELHDEAQAYDELVEALAPLPFGSLTFGYRRHKGGRVTVGSRCYKLKAFVDPTPIAESDAWLLALDGHWFRCRVASRGRSLWISDAKEDIRGGMSGSPFVPRRCESEMLRGLPSASGPHLTVAKRFDKQGNAARYSPFRRWTAIHEVFDQQDQLPRVDVRGLDRAVFGRLEPNEQGVYS